MDSSLYLKTCSESGWQWDCWNLILVELNRLPEHTGCGLSASASTISPGPSMRILYVAGQEYQWEGRPIATHQKEGGSREFDRDPVSRAWLDKVCVHLGLARDEMGAIGRGEGVHAR